MAASTMLTGPAPELGGSIYIPVKDSDEVRPRGRDRQAWHRGPPRTKDGAGSPPSYVHARARAWGTPNLGRRSHARRAAAGRDGNRRHSARRSRAAAPLAALCRMSCVRCLPLGRTAAEKPRARPRALPSRATGRHSWSTTDEDAPPLAKSPWQRQRRRVCSGPASASRAASAIPNRGPRRRPRLHPRTLQPSWPCSPSRAGTTASPS